MGIPQDAVADGGLKELLRIRETQLGQAMALGGIGAWEWDVALGTVTWSAELRRILGVDDGHPATADAFMELVHPEDRAWAREANRECMRTGVTYERPFRVVQPGGAVRVVKVRGMTTRYRESMPVYMVGVIQDLGGGELWAELARGGEALDSFSAREREVLVLVAEGNSSKAIARQLSLSPKTVDTYRSRAMAKVGVEDVASLVRFCIRHGLSRL